MRVRTAIPLAAIVASLLVLGGGESLPGTASATADGASRKAERRACSRWEHDDPTTRQAERMMRCLINNARKRHGIGTLDTSRKLQRSAALKGKDILSCQDYDHYACGDDVWQEIRAVGYLVGCAGAGENLYWESGRYGTARFTLRQWMRSPPHRRALLRGRYDDLGVGLRRGTMNGTRDAQVWVAHFGYRC